MDCRDILALLPHRYPFMLVDRVIGYEPDKSLTAIKNVTFNEPFFQGHFPEIPIMPGVLMLEAMAQTCGLLAIKISGVTRESGVLLYFAGIDNARFKRPVTPGDQLKFVATIDRYKRAIWKFNCVAMVDDEVVCEAALMCALKTVEKAAENPA